MFFKFCKYQEYKNHKQNPIRTDSVSGFIMFRAFIRFSVLSDFRFYQIFDFIRFPVLSGFRFYQVFDFIDFRFYPAAAFHSCGHVSRSPRFSVISREIFSSAFTSSSPSQVSVMRSLQRTQAPSTLSTLFAFVVVFPKVSVIADLYLIASVQSCAAGFKCSPASVLITNV